MKENALVRNAADAGQVKSARKKIRSRRLLELKDLKDVLALECGRRFLWRILKESGIYKTSYSMDALTMALNEGQRNLGLFLLSDIKEADEKALFLMMEEAGRSERAEVEPEDKEEKADDKEE